jgi:hypothetical protein
MGESKIAILTIIEQFMLKKIQKKRLGFQYGEYCTYPTNELK